jgi:hypothetical protein
MQTRRVRRRLGKDGFSRVVECMITCAGCAKDDKGAAKSRRRANAMVETGLSG